MPSIRDFFPMEGIEFTINRHGAPSRIETAVHDRQKSPKRSKILFSPDTDIAPGDVLVSPDKKTYQVLETEIEYFGRDPYSVIAYYEPPVNVNQMTSSPVFNIQNAYGSVIGVGNYATINYNSQLQELKDRVASEQSSDKEAMEKIISLLEMIVNDQVPASKGIFSKFSSVMNRHSWLSSAVASTLLAWLTQHIP